MSVQSHSYWQILRSSSIMGGAAGLNYLIALLRVKVVAILLGPTGVGLVSLYTSAIGLLGTVSGLGIGSSAVREVTRAFGHEDAKAAARTVRILRRASWGTGILGWLLAVALAEPISVWLFGSTDQITAIAVLGVTLLLSAISAGQLALLQGLRRIGDIAWANVLGTFISTVVAIALYAWLGQDGILPVLVVTALINTSLSYWFSSRVPVTLVDVSWADTFEGAKQFLNLGIAFMWSAVLAAGLDALTRSVVTHEFGVHAAGVYQAAWALSGMFAGFILGAMGADYYPRLTSVIHDKAQAIRMVNEQTEVGILMALPGLLATLTFAPWIMTLFYTPQFLQGAELLPWMVLGVFGRVLSWPMGFILLAKGASRWVLIAETGFSIVQVAVLFLMVEKNGLVGVAQAFAIAYALHILSVLWISRLLIGFTWSRGAKRLVALSFCCIFAGFIAPLIFTGVTSVIAGGLITLTGSLVSLRGLMERLGSDNKLAKWLSLAPGSWVILPRPKT